MTHLWLERGTLGHREDLRLFRCTEATSARPSGTDSEEFTISHPAPWELEVQAFIHELMPPLTPPDVLDLGYVDDELVSVCNFSREDHDYFFIRAVATSYSRRRVGLGRKTLGIVLDDIVVDAAQRGAVEVTVACLIHQQNEASSALFSWAGFRRHLKPVDDVLNLWSIHLLTPALSEDWERLWA